MPPLSGITSTRSTPRLCAAVSTRSTMLTRSAICRLLALAMMRRMSRAETGFAMMPMVAMAGRLHGLGPRAVNLPELRGVEQQQPDRRCRPAQRTRIRIPDDDPRSFEMTDFILVHGAWHGGWCWRDTDRKSTRLNSSHQKSS